MSIEVKMPRLSDTMEQGTVVRWAVKPGQKVKSGDVVADIETDKATMELQTFDDGTVADLSVPEGSTVKVGTVIMRLAEAGESLSQGAPSASSGAPPAPARTSSSSAGTEAARGAKNPTTGSSQTESPLGPPSGTAAAVSGERREQDRRPATHTPPNNAPGANGRHTTSVPADTDRIFVSPLARKIAAENHLNLSELEGTGPSGRIIRRDVEAAIASPPSHTAPSALPNRSDTRPQTGRQPAPAIQRAPSPLRQSMVIPLSNMRTTIARRLVQSKATIPHYQVTVSVRMDALLSLRAQLNDQLAAQGVKLSVNDFLVRACALAMHQHHHVNSRWIEGGAGVPPAAGAPAIAPPAIELLPDINIGIAIALPLNDRNEGGGLVVATLRNADQMGLRQISADSKRLGDKARGVSGKPGLSIEEMSDSTFTISNLGMFGVEHFTAIINPPNAAILAVGAAVEKPVVITDPRTGQKTLGIGHEMQMTMSSDHRIVDGAMAAQYLATVKQLLEAPATLLV